VLEHDEDQFYNYNKDFDDDMNLTKKSKKSLKSKQTKVQSEEVLEHDDDLFYNFGKDFEED